MRRVIGFLLVMHGLAHAGAGMWLAAAPPVWLVTVLWWLAMAGFLSAGTGLLGVRWLDRRWRLLSCVAAGASLALLALSWHPILMIGAAIDGAILLDAIPFVHDVATRRLGVPKHPPHRHLARLGAIAAALLIGYLTTVLALRPLQMRWGVTDTELAARLTGDAPSGRSAYRVDHGITIRAPADSVWPWLAQIGQDRGGFYSYSWLERLVGDPIRNADRIVPEWQSLEVGDLVRAAPTNYLGGIFGRDLGWRVTQLVPGRALVLDGWGSFVIRAVDDTTSRLLVRTRGDGKPSLAGVPLAAFGLLVLEPAHFVMERGMLRGIKERAERRTGS